MHVHEPLMPFVSWAALRAGPPVVATFHAAPSSFGRAMYRLLGGSLTRILGSNVTAVTAVSSTAAMVLPATLPASIVPNAIETADFQPSVDKKGDRVAFIGRDEPRKGLDVLIEAWRGVSEAVPSAELVVMGAKRDIDEIQWIHPVADSEKAAILGASGVYVAPSLGGESFGVVLVEGMSAGAAIVSSDLEAYRDVADDAAVYFEAGDAEGLAAALVEVLQSESKRHELAESGRQRAAMYDWSVVAAQYRSLYREALS